MTHDPRDPEASSVEPTDSTPMSRRAALTVAAGGAVGAAIPVLASLRAPSPAVTPTGSSTGAERHARMPVVYLPHGGGPWPFMTQSMGEPEALAALTDYLVGLRELCSPRPRAALVISAHWEEPVATVMTHPQPPLLFDYSGFPPETYRLTWGARTDLQLAARVQTLLRSAGLHTESDSTRGYDHGTFVPLKLTWPQGEMPIVQLSLLASLDPGAHIALGKALEPLRDEGILIVGSGMSFHNMRAMRMHGSNADSDAFDQWLAQTVSLDESQRNEQLARWASAPGGRASHPREEHLLPLMVVAGAAGQDRGRVAFRTRLFGATVAAHHFG